MATNTYVELDKKTVDIAVSSVNFTSIPQGYTDLVIMANPIATVNGLGIRLQFNNDTSASYSKTTLSGYGGTGHGSTRTTGSTFINSNWQVGGGTGGPSPHTYSINNYSNSTTYKTVLYRANIYPSGGNSEVTAEVGAWRKTNAVTSINMSSSTGSFAVGSTFSLYGIKAWSNTEASPKASGGYVYSDSNYWYHAFPFSSTFTPNQSVTADILQIAGGGGAGYNGRGGGGGAGGVLYHASQSLTATSYNVTVGAGGAIGLPGVSGTNSQFASLTASTGGGGGGGGGGSLRNGLNGGSGGGAATLSGAGTAGTGTIGQGNNGGGATETPPQYGAGGGGGAGSAGTTGTATKGGNGGNGINTYSSFATATQTGVNGYYAAGGGGAVYTDSAVIGLGGLGGGGNGASDNVGGTGSAISIKGTPAVVSTGSGGGGGSDYQPAGAGASGIVIVRYAK